MSIRTVPIDLNEEEQKAFNEYAKFHGIPLSTLFKKSLEEKMEDEIDMKAIQEYEEGIRNNSNEFYDHDEVKKLLGL